MCLSTGTHGVQKTSPRSMGAAISGSYEAWILRAEHRFSTRAASTLNPCAIFPYHKIVLYKYLDIMLYNQCRNIVPSNQTYQE